MDFDAMYAACTGRDARFDGRFYMGVRTTGIYCRPSCPAAKPRRANVEFLPTAAACQAAGYRACRRCVPEALPGSPEWSPTSTTTARALRLVDDGVVDAEGVEGLARRLGYSARNLNRILVAETGAPALAHARARRARLAHNLIRSTATPMADVAFAAGFASIRQFNDTIREVYGETPTQLRQGSREAVAATTGTLRASLPYRAPFDFAAWLGFLAPRVLPGIEAVDGATYARSLALPLGPAVAEVTDDPARSRVLATFHLADLRDYGPATAAVRRLLDLDADPVGIQAELARLDWLEPLLGAHPGIRAPGCGSPFEALLRAVTGQQISVVAAHGQMVRICALAAEPLAHPAAGITHAFPTPEAVLGTLDDWFAGPASRRAYLENACTLAASGALEPARGLDEVRADLLATRGIGAWTIGYTMLRAYNDPDADLGGDGALLATARRLGLATDAKSFKSLFATASPWRSYAALHLWAHHATPRTTKETP